MDRLKNIFNLCRYRIIGFSIVTFIHIIFIRTAWAASIGAETKKSSDVMPFLWMIIVTGGCIAITLTYVSWRKYKGEKEKKKQKDKTVD